MDPSRDYGRTQGYKHYEQGSQSGRSHYSSRDGHGDPYDPRYVDEEAKSKKKSKSSKLSQSQSRHDRTQSNYSRSQGHTIPEYDGDMDGFSDTASTVHDYYSHMNSSQQVRGMGAWANEYTRNLASPFEANEPNTTNQAEHYAQDPSRRRMLGQYDYARSDGSNSQSNSNYALSHSSRGSDKRSRLERSDTPLSSHYSRRGGH